MGKDYYKILGVEKNASPDEIKQAFRKLAHQHHPDKQGGDEAKFKEINEAYQVLGNPEKRGQYDQFGATFDQQGGFGGGMGWEDFMSRARGGGGFNGFDFGGIDLGDIFGDMFGFGGGGRDGRRKSRGSDIQVDFQIDFKESVFGVTKRIELYKAVKCDHCHGNMAEPGTKIVTCLSCDGKGRVTRVQRTFLGNFQTQSVCSDCNGEGKIAEKKCSQCRGQGIVNKKEEIEINVPAGIEAGSTIRFTGKGAAAPYGGSVGDLYVNIRVRKDKKFERRGNDILTKYTIPMKIAALGGEVDIETLEGVVSLKIPAGTQPNTQFRLKGKGVPQMHSSHRGDMYVEAEVEIPRHLSRRQRQLLEEFEE